MKDTYRNMRIKSNVVRQIAALKQLGNFHSMSDVLSSLVKSRCKHLNKKQRILFKVLMKLQNK